MPSSRRTNSPKVHGAAAGELSGENFHAWNPRVLNLALAADPQRRDRRRLRRVVKAPG